MNLREILGKHLGNYYMAPLVMEQVLKAMKEAQIQYVFENICPNCDKHFECELNGAFDDVCFTDKYEPDFSCFTPSNEVK